MRISDIKKEARQSLAGYWAIGALLTFLVFLIDTVLPSILEIVTSGGLNQWLDDQTPLSVYYIEWIYSILLIPLYVAVLWFYLSLVRSKEPGIVHVFTIYNDWKLSLKMIRASILMGIFVVLWSLLLVIPGVIKGFSYSQTLYILRDHPEYSVLEAITESRKLMNGYKAKYFLLNLSFIGWAILAAIPALIGYLWFVPYFIASLSAFYNKLVEIPAGTQDTLNVPTTN
ncbi:DUF975 family protein [Sporolactobacillus sp. THM7-4]|nr:DUF975 family protein [Sporolactobacillus sp. THM7-4]